MKLYEKNKMLNSITEYTRLGVQDVGWLLKNTTATDVNLNKQWVLI